MITPFRPDGSLDLDAAQKVAGHLADQGNDALIVNGTTGEAPTTSDAEKSELLRAVCRQVQPQPRLNCRPSDPPRKPACGLGSTAPKGEMGPRWQTDPEHRQSPR